MYYISTRGQAPQLDFPGVVTAGLATDGGLYVPEQWPVVDAATLHHWKTLGYAELAVEVMSLFAGSSIPRPDLERMARTAYAGFSHPAVAPLVQLDQKQWVLELFHGPTLAFKDFAMQFLGQLFQYLLERSGERRTIIGATSGDTGSAAIEAVRGLPNVQLFMLYPEGRVSDVQRRQMTTIADANIHTVAVQGDFDDCQRLVKDMFNDASFRTEMNLSAVNSVNWARVGAQVVYYFWAGLALGAPDTPLSFSVPSGNFGNVFAGYVARRMGLPIEQLIVGSNQNDSLTRFFDSGTMRADKVRASISPSMDVQVSSNFERLLFEMGGRDGSVVSSWMSEFRREGAFRVGSEQHRLACDLFVAGRLSDAETRDEMSRLFHASGYIIDPHSAIGTATARRVGKQSGHATVVLATAHPAKFPQAVHQAIGIEPKLPPRVAHILHAEERSQRSDARLESIQSLIRDAG